MLSGETAVPKNNVVFLVEVLDESQKLDISTPIVPIFFGSSCNKMIVKQDYSCHNKIDNLDLLINTFKSH